MRKIETIEELHSIILSIGKEFHRICELHNIPYYMLGGTMLGAVRHKGIIPWDDDMDFGIPREHYDRFLKIAQKELSNQYSLRTIDNSSYILNGMAKIELNTTVVEERFAIDQDEKIGIFIDIFPLDKTNGDFCFYSKNKMISYVLNLGGYRFMSIHNRPFLKKIIALFIKVLLAPFTPKSMLCFINQYLITNKGDYLANHFGAWQTRETMPKDYYGTPRLYQFEDTEFYGVGNPELYLTHLYGDWKQLPPENKRHIHILEMYYK